MYLCQKASEMLAHIPGIKHTDSGNFFLIAGPCVVESEEMTLGIAKTVQALTAGLKIPYIFKASYRKANRSRGDSFTGIGDEPSLSILKKVKETLGLPVLTDIHESHEAATAAEVADILQIPAFLCTQTHLLIDFT